MFLERLNTLTRAFLTSAVAAALALTPAAAIAGGKDEQAQNKERQTQSMDQSAQGMEQQGDQVTLTEQEAENWKLLPVQNANGEQVGQVAAVTLAGDGSIEALRVDTGQQLGLGEKTVTVQPDQFTTNGARIKLDISNQEIQDLPEAEAAQ